MTKERNMALENYFVISCVNVDGSRNYESTDYQSGYPFWSLNLRQAKQYAEPPAVNFTDCRYMLSGGATAADKVIRIEVLHIFVTADIVTVDELMTRARATAEEEIAKIRKDLEEKIQALNNIK